MRVSHKIIEAMRSSQCLDQRLQKGPTARARSGFLQYREITYNALISACEKGEQPEQDLESFNAMGSRTMPGSALVTEEAGEGDSWDLRDNEVNYNALISAC